MRGVVGTDRQISVYQHSEGLGNYSKEWAMLGEVTLRLFSDTKGTKKYDQLVSVVENLKKEANKDNPEPSVRPDIVSVVVK